MPRDHERKPSLSEAGRKDAVAKQQRLSVALRDNLLKRKAQQRARAGQEEAPDPVAADKRDKA